MRNEGGNGKWSAIGGSASGGKMDRIRDGEIYHKEHKVNTDGLSNKINELSNKVIGCAIEVHQALGPGLLESSYEQCLARELTLAGINFKLQAPLPIEYKGIKLDCGYRVDILVERSLIVELKSVEKVSDIHKAQLLTYMKIAKLKLGLLINFNVKLLKDGIQRFIL